MQTDVDLILSEFADDAADYDRQGGFVLLTRQGRDYAFDLVDVPGAGTCVRHQSSGSGRTEDVPLMVFVQRELLDLPRLASQVVKLTEKSATRRPTGYIDGPSELSASNNPARWEMTCHRMQEYLQSQEAGSTRLIQLMGGAGQGKTVLLEELARESALAYTPQSHPLPLLLYVDLLGRYVGTIDDAIAGSLNNAYMFPGLTQRDVVSCIRNRWIILALDGFDELVARVGARDAFLRITELLDQLKGAGTLILSAREAFFELYQISAAIRSYLQPRIGSYNTSAIRLLPWRREEGVRVFESLGSERAENELDRLLEAFREDEIVLQPFFLTRLANLWQKGERFTDAGGGESQLWRTEYIINTFIERESETKWVDRDKRPLLNRAAHSALLSGLAEEMWRSGAFRLLEDELRIAAQLALAPLSLPAVVLEQVIERAPTHAALVPRDRGYSFVHERFLQYYLALRLKDLLGAGDAAAVAALLGTKELSPDSLLWLEFFFEADQATVGNAIDTSLSLTRGRGDSETLRGNLAAIAALLLDSYSEPRVLEGMSFGGEALAGRRYAGLSFDKCEFWQIDLTGSRFIGCVFQECQFGEVLLGAGSAFEETVFRDCVLLSVEEASGQQHFDPSEVTRALERSGARVETAAEMAARAAFARRVAEDAVEAVARAVRRSQQSCDLAVDELEPLGRNGRAMVRIGLESGVLREVHKTTSGPRKDFVRFQVDRQLLVRGQVERTGVGPIDTFWDMMAQRFPRRN